jgi:hypothetical protein
MAKGTFTLRDVPPHLRAKRAEKARQQVRDHLEHPALTEGQRGALHTQLGWIAKWEKGDVPLPEPAEPRVGTEHRIDLVEDLAILSE